MYPDTRDDSTELIKKIVALTAAAICLLMFFLPWIRVGFFSDSTQIGMQDLLEDALGADIDEIISELNNISDFLPPGASYDETLKQTKIAKSAITHILSAVKDNRLSPVELSLVCLNSARMIGAARKLNDYTYSSDQTLSHLSIYLIAAGILLLALMLGCVGAIGYFFYRKLSRQRSLGIAHSVLYMVILLLFVALTILVNMLVRDNAWKWDSLRFTNLRLIYIHLQIFPFVGMVLLIASIVVQVALPDTTRRRMPPIGYADYGRVPDYAVRREPPAPPRSVVTGGGAWNCACGNTGVTTAFCPRCGRKRPEPPAASETSSTVVGGGMKPAYCERCGSPIASGKRLCRACAAAADSAPRVTDPAASAEKIVPRVKGLDINPDFTVEEHVEGRVKEAESAPKPRLKIRH